MRTESLHEAKRNALHKEDKGFPIRKPHQNPAIKKVYSDFLKEHLEQKSHKLLHTKIQ